MLTQECIPVGCVPAARRLYAAVCFPGGCLVWGVWSGPGGSGLAQGGLVGGSLVWSGLRGSGPGGSGVCSGGGVGGLVRGGCTPVVSQHALRQTPSHEQNK